MSVSVSSTPLGNTTETPLQKETQLFRELFSRLINAFVNRIFDLRPEKAARRMRYLLLLFVIAVFAVSLRFYPLDLWTKYIRDIFLYYLNPSYPSIYIGNPLVNFANYIYHVFTDPRIFQYFPILLAPFFIALQSASLYLADIFELENVSIARGFIWSVALSGSEETIHVSHGEISEEDRHSPAFLIGGPGKVIVDLDSVAMFEKPDGTPHIIGPTTKEPRARATLDGFERFRQAIDTRDQYVELRDQDDRSKSVESRSLDGIRITATDVRLMFSIYRGGKPSTENPYQFSKEAFEQMIYQATSKVTPDRPNPSTYEFNWINRMIGLIRGELSAFMSKHKLTAYLASIGMPELEKMKQREDRIFEEKQNIVPPEQDIASSKEPKNPLPEFQPRHKISNLFTQFAEEFTKKAHSNGVELHWIGVGTWKTSVEIVPERHLEAWKLSNENLYRESPEELSKLENEAILQKTIMLIQDVPIVAQLKATTEEKDARKAMRLLLLAYQQQLLEAAEFMRAKGEAIPPNSEEAIAHINNMFGHFL